MYIGDFFWEIGGKKVFFKEKQIVMNYILFIITL